MLDARSNSHTDSHIISCHRYKGPLRVIAFITLWSFLFSTGGGEILVEDVLLGHKGYAGKAWAAETYAGPSSVGPAGSGSPASIKELDIKTFILPQRLGYIKDSWSAGNQKPKAEDRVVIHIQDAPCNYAAQHKIADIVGYLSEKYGITAINLEGGEGAYDLSLFADIR